MRGISNLLSSLLSKTGPGRVTLEIDLDRGVLRAAPENPLEAFRAINAPTINGLTTALREAVTDERVAGLVVHIGTCPLSASMVDEVGAAIRQFGEHKPTVAYAETFGELTSGMFAYRLATAASTIWLQPSGGVVLSGVHVDMVLLRGGLEKLGMDPQFSQRKEYKTAAESYSASAISDANREMSSRLAASLVEETVAIISERRGLTADAVREVLDRGPVAAEEARTLGLVDHLGYRDDVYSDVRSSWGNDATLQYASRYIGSIAARAMSRLATKPTVAVVSVRGGIVSGRPVRSPLGGPQAGSEVVLEHLRHARHGRQRQGGRPGRRLARWLVHRIGHHPCGGARAEEGRQARGGDHGRRRGVGRLLRRHGRDRDRREPVDAHRLDRRVRGQDRQPGAVRQARADP